MKKCFLILLAIVLVLSLSLSSTATLVTTNEGAAMFGFWAWSLKPAIDYYYASQSVTFDISSAESGAPYAGYVLLAPADGFRTGYTYTFTFKLTYSVQGQSVKPDLSVKQFYGIANDLSALKTTVLDRTWTPEKVFIPTDNYSLKAVYVGPETAFSLVYKYVQGAPAYIAVGGWGEALNSGARLTYSATGYTCVYDPDDSYFDARVQEQLDDINNKLDDIGGTLDDIKDGQEQIHDDLVAVEGAIKDQTEQQHQDAEDIKQGIDDMPQNEYDFIKDKQEEVDADLGELESLLSVEDFKKALTGLYDAVSSEKVRTTIIFPKGEVFGVKLWDETTVDLNRWLADGNIAMIITIAKVLSTVVLAWSCVRFILKSFNSAFAPIGEN